METYKSGDVLTITEANDFGPIRTGDKVRFDRYCPRRDAVLVGGMRGQGAWWLNPSQVRA